MAKFNRYDGNVLPFGSSSSVGERWTFGSGGSLVSNDIDDNLNADYLAGWEAGLNSEGYPTSQDFNAQQYTNSLLVSYIYQTGIPEWNENQEYNENSITMASDGNIYQSLTDSNIGNNPTTDSTNWVNKEDKSFSDNQILATNGYQILPGGLILQWGSSNAMPLPNGSTVTFPISFPTVCVNIVTGDKTTGNLFYSGVDSITSTSFKLYTSHAFSDNLYWFAIGY